MVIWESNLYPMQVIQPILVRNLGFIHIEGRDSYAPAYIVVIVGNVLVGTAAKYKCTTLNWHKPRARRRVGLAKLYIAAIVLVVIRDTRFFGLLMLRTTAKQSYCT